MEPSASLTATGIRVGPPVWEGGVFQELCLQSDEVQALHAKDLNVWKGLSACFPEVQGSCSHLRVCRVCMWGVLRGVG